MHLIARHLTESRLLWCYIALIAVVSLACEASSLIHRDGLVEAWCGGLVDGLVVAIRTAVQVGLLRRRNTEHLAAEVAEAGTGHVCRRLEGVHVVVVAAADRGRLRLVAGDVNRGEALGDEVFIGGNLLFESSCHLYKNGWF